MKQDLRIFGIILGVILAAIGIRLFFEAYSNAWLYLAATGALCAVGGVFFPLGLAPVYKVWMPLARAIGWLNTKILLLLVFYIFFAPFGLVMKIFQRDLLGLKIEKKTVSYWIRRPPQKTDRSQYEKQF